MRKLLLLSLLSLMGCSHIKYVEVPVETVRTEYIENKSKDSVFVYVTDSSTTIVRNDTVLMEKYRTIYRDKYLYKKDTVAHNDTVPVIQKVTEVREVNVLKKWQIVMIWLGVAMTGGCLLGLVWWIYGKVRK